MIEFEHVTTISGPEQTAPIVVNSDRIAHFEPLIGSEDRCRIVLTDGRQLIATIPYVQLRRLLLDSRSGFATARSS